MRLGNETPSAMVQEYYSLPFDAYQTDLWQHLVLGALIGAGLAFIVCFALLVAAQSVQS